MQSPQFELKMAETEAERLAAQRLRYAVFVEELGSDGAMVDHGAGLEADRFDPHFEHMLLLDHQRPNDDKVVGVYRLMRRGGAEAAGQYYTEDEYDLGPLRASGRTLLELGRSCLHRDYRGGVAMMHMWNGISDYIETHSLTLLLGGGSFHGPPPDSLSRPLWLLHHRHLAPEDVRPRALDSGFQRMDLIAAEDLDRPAAIRAIPALIKAYLRLGGFVGEGAFIDRAFNCIDICLVIDVARMSDTHRAIYTRSAAAAPVK